jgi:hypothetical protein
MAAPLRTIVARPSQLQEKLECGHIVGRPLSLGEDATQPSKALRRRCYLCSGEAA